MTHNLLIYPSTLPGEPLERYEAHGVTLDQWLHDNVPSYQPGDQQPISATVNGVVVEPSQWPETYITHSTAVELRPQPQGVETMIIAAVVAAVAVAATVLLRPSIPSQGSNRRSTRGSSIYEANGQANSPKLGDVIPEIAGRHKTYPDYLLPPRRYFRNRKEQWMEMLLCIGKGKFQIAASSIKVGDTPAISLGDAVEYRIYQPGESLSGDTRAQWWHTVSEVGDTSMGGSGLTLTTTSLTTPSANAGAYALAGNLVVVPEGAGSLPNGWEAGMIARIEAPQSYTVKAGGTHDIIRGDLEELAPFAGMAIEIVGENAGNYVVHSYTPYVAADGDEPEQPAEITLDYPGGGAVRGLTPGRMAMGYRGLRYRLLSASASSISVERLTDAGGTDGGWPGFVDRTVTDGRVSLDENSLEGNWAGPFLACPASEVTNKIDWDVLFPQGLSGISNKGDLFEIDTTTELQYRDYHAAGEWVSIVKKYVDSTLDQIGFSETVNLPYAMTPEVRMRRIGAEDTDTQRQNRVQWYGLRSRLGGVQVRERYDGVTTLAIRFRGGNNLAAQSENRISLEATRVLPVRNGAEWGVETPTRNIAPWVAHVAKSAGYTDDEIDFDELDRLDAIWQARGDYFDFVQDDDSTVKEALNRALRPGFAELTIDQGRIRPVRDEPRSTFEHMYTPQNMLGPLKRSVQAPRPDDPDGVDVEYFDADTWTTETVECRLPGDQGVRAEKLRIEGVTNRTRAWRIGMRERRRQKYRRWTYSFSTELDALNSRYMSYCALADDIPGYAQSALVEGVEVDSPDVHLLSSEPLEWQTGKSHVVAWRRPDGTLAGPFPAQPGDDERHVIAQMDETPVIDYQREPPHLLFGTTDEWSFPVLITSINPRGFESVSVDAVNYDERIYADDLNSPS